MPLTPHDEYYHKMRDKAHDKMARVTGHEADGDDELRCSLAYAFKHGTADEAAEAIGALSAIVAQITKIGVPNEALCPGVPPVTVQHTTTTTPAA